jgi:hypothetical protein
VPPGGLIVGAATLAGSTLIVYVAEAVSLSIIPSLNALALTVTVPLLTEMGIEYTVEEDVGSEPSTV